MKISIPPIHIAIFTNRTKSAINNARICLAKKTIEEHKVSLKCWRLSFLIYSKLWSIVYELCTNLNNSQHKKRKHCIVVLTNFRTFIVLKIKVLQCFLMDKNTSCLVRYTSERRRPTSELAFLQTIGIERKWNKPY